MFTDDNRFNDTTQTFPDTMRAPGRKLVTPPTEAKPGTIGADMIALADRDARVRARLTFTRIASDAVKALNHEVQSSHEKWIEESYYALVTYLIGEYLGLRPHEEKPDYLACYRKARKQDFRGSSWFPVVPKFVPRTLSQEDIIAFREQAWAIEKAYAAYDMHLLSVADLLAGAYGVETHDESLTEWPDGMTPARQVVEMQTEDTRETIISGAVDPHFVDDFLAGIIRVGERDDMPPVSRTRRLIRWMHGKMLDITRRKR